MNKYELKPVEGPLEIVEANSVATDEGALVFRLLHPDASPGERYPACRIFASGAWQEVRLVVTPIDPPAPAVEPQPQDLTGEPQPVTRGGGCVDLSPDTV